MGIVSPFKSSDSDFISVRSIIGGSGFFRTDSALISLEEIIGTTVLDGCSCGLKLTFTGGDSFTGCTLVVTVEEALTVSPTDMGSAFTATVFIPVAGLPKFVSVFTSNLFKHFHLFTPTI